MKSEQQYRLIQSHLSDLRLRFPDLPITGVLLCRLLQHLGRALSGMLEQKLRPFELTEPELRVLATLFARPDGSAHPSELCAITEQSAASMSRISDVLVGRDLITRVLSLRDRRKMVLQISPRGADLAGQLLPLLYAPVHALFAHVSDDEQRQLFDQLQQIVQKLEADMATHP